MTERTRILYIITTTILLITSSGNLILSATGEPDYPHNFMDFPLTVLPEPIRQPAEFEPMEGVLIRYSFGISYEIIAEMAEYVEVVTIVDSASQQSYVESLFLSHGVNLNHCRFLISPSDSYWTRDYGPWFVFTENDELGVIDFTYNRPRPYDNAIPSAYASDQGFPLYYIDLVHSGGNYMTDGQGISVSTNLVWTENPGYAHKEINEIAYDYLGITTYHVVPDALGEYIKHIDCWAKYLAPDVIMIIEVSPSHSHYNEIEESVEYFENQTSCYGTPYQIERVYTHLSEPYINSLILNDKVMVPITGSSWDDEAIESYENAMPGYEVLGFSGSWASTDAIHCRAKGLPDRYMLYIEHTPLYGVQNGNTGVDIQAKIVPYSGESLISESTCVYWKEENGTWDSEQMTSSGNDNYRAVIYPQEDGLTVDYYIHAEDNSGRSENHPYIGEEGTHSFIVNITNNPPEKPNRPSGSASGKIGSAYVYSTSTHDPNDDQVFYKWDWGDGNVSNWIGPYNSGETASAKYTWTEKGTYEIKVKAKDTLGKESNWSEPLEVSMPKNVIYSLFFEFIQNYFPRLYMIIETIKNY